MKKQFNNDGTITLHMTEEEYFNSQFNEQRIIGKNETRSSETNLPLEVTDLLSKMGTPRCLQGFNFIREAINLSVSDPNYLNKLHEKLYAAVAEKFQTRPELIERSIRHAIEVTWKKGDMEVINSYFNGYIVRDKGRPTVSEFLASITDILRLKYA